MYDKDQKVSFEGLYYEVDTHMWDRDIKHDKMVDQQKKTEYYKQKEMMKNHKKLYFIG